MVQAFYYSKYLGHFEVEFDQQGDLKTPVDGTGVKYAMPILLDNSINEDQTVLVFS